MTTQIPSRDVLKTQAKTLRRDMAARGNPMTHAEALETVAHQWGARDWNTLSAQSARAIPGYTPGMRVSGRYLGHSFDGVVKAARLSANGFWSLTLRFDQAIDVVTSELFSSFRRQVNVTVNARGETAQKTSDGVPHLVLDRP